MTATDLIWMEISPGRFNGERFRNRQTAVHKPYTLRTFHPSSLTEIRHDRSRKSPRPRPAAGTAHPVTATIAYNHNPEGTALSVTAIATDADLPGDVLTYSLLTAPDGATIDAESGVITWPTAEADGPGVYSFSVQVFDNGDPARSGEQGFHVTVLEVNTPPTLGAIPAVSGDELTAFTFTATGADADLLLNRVCRSASRERPTEPRSTPRPELSRGHRPKSKAPVLIRSTSFSPTMALRR